MLDNRIEAKETFIKDLFDSKFLFRIPEYQRQFSWEKENFEQLFQDIKESFIMEDENYFLGSIILQVRELNSDGSGSYDVVDGQQRLTTLTILLAVMRDLSNSSKAKETLQDKIYQEENEFEGTKEEVRLLVRDKDKEFFRKYVFEKGATENTPSKSNLTEPQKRIVIAIETFKSKFEEEGTLNEDLLNNMIKYILNKCILVYVKTGNFTSAFRLFSILNDRGMPLTTSDLLKSTNLGAINENIRKQYQVLWEQIEEDLGRDELDKLLAFIRTILIKGKLRKTIVDEYNEIIFNHNIIQPGEEFIQYLKQVAYIYEERILNANLDYDSEYSVLFYNLMSIMRDFIPFSDWMPVFISFALKYDSQKDLYEFLNLLERVYTINWVIGVTSSKRVIDTTKIIQVIEKSETKDDVFNNEVFNLKEFEEEVHSKVNGSLFYKMKYSKYILLRLDLSLSENSNIEKSYKGVISVEHVLPQKPKDHSQWKLLFDEIEREKATHSLGNLVLLSRKKNSSANNKDFKEKITKYYVKGITDFALTKEIMTYDKWDKMVIEKRQMEKVNTLMGIYFGKENNSNS